MNIVRIRKLIESIKDELESASLQYDIAGALDLFEQFEENINDVFTSVEEDEE